MVKHTWHAKVSSNDYQTMDVFLSQKCVDWAYHNDENDDDDADDDDDDTHDDDSGDDDAGVG